MKMITLGTADDKQVIYCVTTHLTSYLLHHIICNCQLLFPPMFADEKTDGAVSSIHGYCLLYGGLWGGFSGPEWNEHGKYLVKKNVCVLYAI